MLLLILWLGLAAVAVEASAQERSREKAKTATVKRAGETTKKAATPSRGTEAEKTEATRTRPSRGTQPEKTTVPSESRSGRVDSRSTRQTQPVQEAPTRTGRDTRVDNNRGRDTKVDNNRGRDTRVDNNRGRDLESRRNRNVDVRQGPYVKPKPRVTYPDHRVYHRYPKYTKRVAYRPNIHLHIQWPWLVRYERHWAPRYRYRQVVYVDAGWGRNRRNARIEVQTYYQHRVIRATDDYAELEIKVEQIELFRDGVFYGQVDRIPSDLGRIRATVYRNGRVDFDRDVFLVGDPGAGFEMISTRHYGGYILDSYRRSDGMRVGELNLRRSRVDEKGRSRLFDPRDFNGFVPISLLPEDDGWLWDFGDEAMSAYYDDYDYYYGSGDGYGGGYAPNNSVRQNGVGGQAGLQVEPFRQQEELQFKTQQGASIQLKRDTEIQRIK